MHNLQRAFIAAIRRMLRRTVQLLRWLPWHAPSQHPADLPSPRRILLLHPGHLGDVVISTSILDPLERSFPGVQIGFVAGSWATNALCGVAGVAAVHILDHWRLNRGVPGLLSRWLQYRRTRALALREIRSRRYDVAISLLDVNPDLLDVAWAARIPVRIGWDSSYFAPLATHIVPHDPRSLQQQAMRQAKTLLALDIRLPELQHLQSRVIADTPQSVDEVCAALRIASLDQTVYRIIHMGAGAPMKQMSLDFWRHIAESLSQEHTLLFTGRGSAERQAVASVIRNLPNCFDACDKLSWSGFVTAIRAAEMVYGVDSMAGHVSAAVGTPVVAAYQGAGGVSRWRPLTSAGIVFTNHLPCAPCLLPQGCAGMACKQIDAASVLNIQPEELLVSTRQRQPEGTANAALACSS